METLADATDERTSRVKYLSDAVLRGRRLILASNRGPVEHRYDGGGRIEAHRGSGGVVTALAALTRYVKVSWVASAMTEADRIVAQGAEANSLSASAARPDLRVRFVVLKPAEYDLYYNVFSNPILWFVQHRLHELLPQKDLATVMARAWRDGYRPANRAFADAIVRELTQGDTAPIVMLHDYHLYLAASYVRERSPRAILQQFIHIPWPEPSVWQFLPGGMVRALCSGALANDIIGFQTNRCVANFLATCAAALPEAIVDHTAGTVTLGGHRCAARSYPISIDVAALRKMALSPQVAEYERRLRPICGEQTIVRVDRLDPSKNVLTGFQAFDRLMERRPDLHGRVKFLSFLVPSRTAIPEYKRYGMRVFDAVESINSKYGRPDWQPIELFYENNHAQAIAAMRLYDVLMINSSLDGMNLVSKEGPVVNIRDGVLVLSRGAGSHEELGGYALSISPYDVEGTARALATALAMPESERRKRAQALRRTVEDNDIGSWLHAQIADIGRLSGRTELTAPTAASLSRSA